MNFELDGPSGPLQIAVTLLLGLGAMGYGAYSYTAQSSALDAAETVNGTIESTSVEEFDERRGTDYGPQATFTYSYEGDSYTSSNVYPGNLPREFDTREAARAQLAGYDPGDTVTVYVPPDAPGDAFLKHSSSNKPFLVVGLGAFFVLVSIVSVFRD